MRRYFQVCAALAALVLLAMIFHAWLTSHDEQLRLQGVIKTQSQLIDAANAREHDRAVALGQTVAEIDKLKRETQTPQQVLQELPKYLPLPQPITMVRGGGSNLGPNGEDLTQGEKRAQTDTSQAQAHRGTGALIDSTEEGSRAAAKSFREGVLSSLAGRVNSVGRVFARRLAPGIGSKNDVSLPSGAGGLTHADPRRASARVSAGGSVSSKDSAGSAADKAAPQAVESKAGSEAELPDAPRLGAHPLEATKPEGYSRPSFARSSDREPGHSVSLQDAAKGRANSEPVAALAQHSHSSSGNANPPSAQIPDDDLKPLYDYVQDCRACQAELSAAKQDHLDDTAKLAALSRERDAATVASKGGTFWRRLRRNVEWFTLGAAAASGTAAGIAVCARHRATP